MNFKRAKQMVLFLLVIGILVCIFGVLMFEDGDTGLEVCIAIAFVMIIMSLMICGVWCKCPYCNKRLFYKLMRLKACPKCGRDFDSGKKVVKVKKK